MSEAKVHCPGNFTFLRILEYFREFFIHFPYFREIFDIFSRFLWEMKKQGTLATVKVCCGVCVACLPFTGNNATKKNLNNLQSCRVLECKKCWRTEKIQNSRLKSMHTTHQCTYKIENHNPENILQYCFELPKVNPLDLVPR